MATTPKLKPGEAPTLPPAVALPRVGHFAALETLYHGSISTVYKARQDRLGRVVALKLLPEYPPPPDVVLERFNRSTYVSAQVVHPNLVVLYESGTADGYHYAALEYVPGRTLQGILSERGRISERRALGLGAQVARALTALHEKGILHRNVKPKNILVDLAGKARLIGLGLAQCEQACFSRHLDAVSIGTPQYMAPEMIRGEGVEPRSDLYALGVTLYAAVAGHPPFERGLPAAVMARHLQETPPPLREARPELSPGFAALVHRLLAKEPGGRPGSARETAELLERLAAALPEAPERREWVAVAGRRAFGAGLRGVLRRRLLLSATGLAVAAAFAAFGLWNAWGVWRGSPVTPAPPPVPMEESAPPAEPGVAAPDRAPRAPFWRFLLGTPRGAGDAAGAAGAGPKVDEDFLRLLAQDADFRRESRGAAEWAAFLRKYPAAPAAYRKEAQSRIELYRKSRRDRPGTLEPPTAGDLEF